jgi:sterol O-acyltransferase
MLTYSSGRSTPLPPDAPPSLQSISSARKQVRAQAKHRAFHRIDYKPRVSHFDPNSDYRDFRGFYVLFWISLAIMVFTTVLRNIKDTGYPLRVKMWTLLSANTWQLGLSDGVMVLSTGLCVPLQKIFRKHKGLLRWSKGGIVVQSLFQAAWLALWIK